MSANFNRGRLFVWGKIKLFFVACALPLIHCVSCSPKASQLKGSYLEKNNGKLFAYQLVFDENNVPLCVLILNQNLPSSGALLIVNSKGGVEYNRRELNLKYGRVIAIYNNGSSKNEFVKCIDVDQLKKYILIDKLRNIEALHQFLLGGD